MEPIEKKIDQLEQKIDSAQQDHQRIAVELEGVRVRLISVEIEMKRSFDRQDGQMSELTKSVNEIGRQQAELLGKQDQMSKQADDSASKVRVMELTRSKMAGALMTLTALAGMFAGAFKWLLDKIGV